MTDEKYIHGQEHEDLNILMLRRREELDQLTKLGINSYPYEFERDTFSKTIIEQFQDGSPQRTVSVAGRIMSLRRMGKASFCHIQDSQGRIQIYLKRDDLGSMYDAFKLMDIGDIIGVRGFIFVRKWEKSLFMLQNSFFWPNRLGRYPL